MKPISISIFEGLPGSGKTFQMMNEMITCPGRYIIAAPRTALIEEHVLSLRSQAARTASRPIIISIHSDQGVVGSIQRRIVDACRQLKADPYVILAITHERLQSERQCETL